MPIETNDDSLTDITWSSGLKIWVRKAGELKDMLLGSAAARNVGTSSGQIPVLNADGKLDSGVLPTVSADISSAVPLAGGTMTGALTFSGTTYAGVVNIPLTTSERDAVVTPTNGSQIYNETTGQIEAYEGGVWRSLRSDLSNAAVGYGAALAAFYNNDGRFDSAATVQAVLDYIHLNFVNKNDATTPAILTSIAPADSVVMALEAGGYGLAEIGIVRGEGGATIVTSAASSLTLQPEYANARILMTSASANTVVIPLGLGWGPNTGVQIVQKGAGTTTMACDDPTIVLNNAADGTVAISKQTGVADLVFEGGLEWNADGDVGTAADTSPPVLVSSNPSSGATGVSISGPYVMTFDEPVAGAADGTNTITLKVQGGSDVKVYDVVTDAGTTAGKVEISGNTVKLHYPAGLANNTIHDVVIHADALEDLTGNEYAGSTRSFTTIAASVSLPTIVASGSAVITTGTGNQTVTLPTMLEDDWLILTGDCDASLTGKTPDTVDAGFLEIYDNSAGSGPSAWAFYKPQTSTPDINVLIPRHSARPQNLGWMIVRASGTLTWDHSLPVTPATGATGSVDFPSRTQNQPNVLRIGMGWLDDDDVTFGTTALGGVGWVSPVNGNTGDGSGLGCSIIMSYLPAGGSATDVVNPPACTNGDDSWIAIHVGIYSA